MKARHRVKAAQQWWGARWQLLPAIISLALLAILGLSAMLSAGWPIDLAAANPFRHVVSQGDTVGDIAAQYGTDATTIASLNELSNPDHIYPGQELKVAPETAPVATAVPAPAAKPEVATQTHVVAEGETLWDIANQYGLELDVVVSHNDMLEGAILSVGQKIVIPSADARVADNSARGGPRVDPYGRIWVPFRSQLDGSAAAGSNCGPATLGMAMSYYGEWWTTAGIRRSVNEYQGTWDPDAGSTWEAMAFAARERGFQVVGLYDGGSNYRQWTIEDLVEQTKAGRPVVLLTRYWSLPGHSDSAWWGDHYVAFLGLTPGGDVIYHDAAFASEGEGAYLTMSKERLIRAWTRTATGLQYTAMALEWPGEE